jgi:predicted unusual protein kinase regulating ubiquinone biosynthesis (AarF/ABC1/UbiB family)
MPAHGCPPPQPYHLHVPSPARFASRAFEVGSVASTRLGPLLAKRASGRSVPAAHLARPLRKACQDLGGTFLKYAQIVASSESLFGADVAAEFRACLDRGPAVPFDEVLAQLERAAGRPVDRVFADIDDVPLGAASLAVVHRARLRDGRDVAVKVLRPGIEARVAADLSLLRQLLGSIAGLVAGRAGGALVGIIDDLKEQLQEELDLRNEARAMAYFRGLPERAQIPLVVVPEPYDELSSRRVLVMEFLDGVPVDDGDWAQAAGIDPAPLVEQVLQAWFMTALRGGIFHGDIHAGNILILRDGRVGLLDWGIVGRLEPDVHQLLRNIVAGALGDASAWVEVASAFRAQMGGASDQLGLDVAVLAPMLEQMLGGVLTRPFGEVSFIDLVMTPIRQVQEMRGGPTSLSGQLRELRSLDGDLPASDRGMSLLARQLAYFERYGKRYLPDRPLLADAEFFRSVLAAGTLADADR